jgi:hypothetical protein
VEDWVAFFPTATLTPEENTWTSNIWIGAPVIDSSLSFLAPHDPDDSACLTPIKNNARSVMIRGVQNKDVLVMIYCVFKGK